MRVLVLLFSLLLAACGGSSSEPAGTASEPAAATSNHDHTKAGEGHDHAKAGDGHDHAAHADAGYACPMHPEVTGKKGDRCSKCNMFLTEGGKEMGGGEAQGEAGHDHGTAGHDHAEGAPAAADYYCPMHPEVTSKEDGQRCGKCNMFLVKPGDEAKHTGG